MLHLDPIDIKYVCATSVVLQNICDDEFFWKQKSIIDFDLPENIVDIPQILVYKKIYNWKEYYFIMFNPRIEMKQAIQKGNLELVNELIEFIPTRGTQSFLTEQEIKLAIDNRQWDIVNHLLKYPIFYEKQDGLKLICTLLKEGDLSLWSVIQGIIISYKQQYPLDYEMLIGCSIQSGSVPFVEHIYRTALSKGTNESGERISKIYPDAYIQNALELGYEDIAHTIEWIYKDYTNWVKGLGY